ncbi:MAG TPA: acyl-CoA thioesterase domain-containing protein [Acidimicrobiales bacterium]|nr:acyl-CoA thioesterase domain-containing protein [Acidimicrobiales bacterium]
MLHVLDVVGDGEHRFVGTGDGGDRRVVDGSQLLGQAIVAASKTFPHHAVRSAHAVFARAVDDERPLGFDVDVTHDGRTFASAVVAVGQGGARCASVTVLLDVEQEDVIRHAAPPPDVGTPDDAVRIDMPMIGRELRLVGVADPNDPDEVGPPVLDAWLRYRPVPERPDLAKALIAHFTGHLSISTTMRAHRGIGTSMAHDSISTAVMTITVAFHDPVSWDGWLLYHHESTQVARGMSYVRGQVFTEEGRLIASFVQEGMIRPFAEDSGAHAIPMEARL